MLEERSRRAKLPPVAERLPKTPLDRRLRGRGRNIGQLWRRHPHPRRPRPATCATSPSTRYTRLVGYDEKLATEARHRSRSYEKSRTTGSSPSLCARATAGPTAQPFTTEDFRYYWEDIAQQQGASPSGPPELLIVDGKLPKVEILDELRSPLQLGQAQSALPARAGPAARLTLIFSPAHYLKQFHTQVRATRASSTKLAARRS